MANIPEIQSVMTAAPHTVDASQPVIEARRMMRDLRIRHLPVILGGNLIAVISERDLLFAEVLRAKFEASSGEMMKVEEICAKDALYTVSPTAKLDEVVAYMAKKGLGSALIVERGELKGIFTTVDACRVLGELVQVMHGVKPDSGGKKGSLDESSFLKENLPVKAIGIVDPLGEIRRTAKQLWIDDGKPADGDVLDYWKRAEDLLLSGTGGD